MAHTSSRRSGPPQDVTAASPATPDELSGARAGRGHARALALAVTVAFAGVVALAWPLTAGLESPLGLAWLFQWRGPVPAPPDVVVVAINHESSQALGLGDRPSEWPRGLHAELVRAVHRAGARVIAFDLTFDTPSVAAENDAAFAQAMREAGNVVLVEALRRETAPLRSPTGTLLGELSTERAAPPIGVLADAARAHAPFPLPRAARVDSYWTFKSGAGGAPSLPVVAFHVHAADAFARVRASVASPSASAPDAASTQTTSLADRIAETRAAIAEASPDALPRAVLTNNGDRGVSLESSLVHLYRGGDEAFLDFYGPAHTVTTVPYARVLAAARAADGRADGFDLASLAGKAIFVGFSTSSQPEQDRIRDDYETVFSRSDGVNVSGVEIAATAFGNLLQDRPLHPLRLRTRLAWVAAWGALLGALAVLLTPLRAACVLTGLAVAYGIGAVLVFGRSGLWLPTVVPLAIQTPLAFGGGVLLHYLEARRDRARIRQAFGYFLPDAVVDQLARRVGPMAPASTSMYGVCLATDAERYTSLAETMAPDVLSRYMNAYYADLFAPVERHGGIVSDVVGDAMLAVWAAPREAGELRARACAAALDIVHGLEQRRRENESRPILATRLGLHAGEIALGSIGASHHFEYRAVGDIVNTASRLQGLNRPLGTCLLASDVTVSGLDALAVRPLGAFLLAGKTTPLRVVEILGPRASLASAAEALSLAFAQALALHECGDLAAATEAFATIVGDHPDHGPSRFYLERCRALSGMRDVPWDPVVKLDSK